jgi:DNA-binding XRE family transcriptional regulator
MYSKINDELKTEVMDNMAQNLVVLRTMLHLTQAQLAEIMGVTRQTLILYETGKRKLTWGSYLSLLFILNNNQSTKPLLGIMRIYPEELKKFFEHLDH